MGVQSVQGYMGIWKREQAGDVQTLFHVKSVVDATYGIVLNGEGWKKLLERVFGQRSGKGKSWLIGALSPIVFFSHVTETTASSMVPCGIEIT